MKAQVTVKNRRRIAIGFIIIALLLIALVFRVAWIYTVFAYFGTILSLYLLYIFSWTITAIAETICFIINYKKLKIAPAENVAAAL